MHKHQYNIHIETLLSLPANVYWKNQYGIYLGCNDPVVDTLQLDSHKDFVGTTLFDLCTSLDSITMNNLNKTDNEIISTGTSLVLIESGGKKISEPRFLTIKQPLYNNDNKIVGLFGISFNLTNPMLINNIRNLQDLKFVGPNKISQGLMKAFSTGIDQCGFQLTLREKECLYYVKRGKTAKEIARFLGISYRTVESHLSNIKMKMKCQSRSQLLDIITSFSL